MTNTPPSIIAIDGPAASEKSTLGLKIAEVLGYLSFDTGVMYRAVTWIALDHDSDVKDEAKITALAEQTPIDVATASRSDGRACDVLVAGKDITWETRLPVVDANVSVVSAYRGVRAALSKQQRRIGQRGKVVMVGRDIGTVVLPEERCTQWNALELEEAMSAAKGCCAMVRTREEWFASEQGKITMAEPLISIQKIGDSDPIPFTDGGELPLSGIRVLQHANLRGSDLRSLCVRCGRGCVAPGQADDAQPGSNGLRMHAWQAQRLVRSVGSGRA